MKSTKIFLILVFALSVLSSCVTNRDTNLFQDIPKEYAMMKEPEYKVIVGDELRITVYTMDPEALEEVLGSFINGGVLNVRADGTIKIPFMGKVYVEGHTLYEIGKLLSEKFSSLSEGTTATVEMTTMYVFIMSEQQRVRMPMDKPVMTIYEVMAKVGAQNSKGDLKRINVLRQTSSGSVLKEFDLRTKYIIDSEFYYIQPNDVLYIPKLARDDYAGGSVNTLTAAIGIFSSLIATVLLVLRLF